jgi:heterodisulfide reductase subunit A-like polyferredoxin
MAVARAARLEALQIREVPVNNTALVIGGGAAGMVAALALADQGFPVHIIEREAELGGNLRRLHYFVPSNGDSGDAAAGVPCKFGAASQPAPAGDYPYVDRAG